MENHRNIFFTENRKMQLQNFHKVLEQSSNILKKLKRNEIESRSRKVLKKLMLIKGRLSQKEKKSSKALKLAKN